MNFVWTTAPTNHQDQEGVYYWCRQPEWSRAEIVRVAWVSRYDTGEEVATLEYDSRGCWRPVADAPPDTLWSDQPIPEPTDPPQSVPCPRCVGNHYPAGRVPHDPMLRRANFVTCPTCDGTGEVPA